MEIHVSSMMVIPNDGKINMSWLIDFFGTIWVLLPQRVAENLCTTFEDSKPSIRKCVRRVRYTYFLYRRTNIAYETGDRGLILVPAVYVMKQLYRDRAYNIIKDRIRMLLPLYVFNLDSSIIIPPITELERAIEVAENNSKLQGLLENLVLMLENLNKLIRQTIRTRERLAKYINIKVNSLKDELMITIEKKIKELVKEDNESCIDNKNLLEAIEDTLREKLSYQAQNIEFNVLNILSKEIAWHTDTIEVLLGLLTIASFLERGKLNPARYPFIRFVETYEKIRKELYKKLYKLGAGQQKKKHWKTRNSSSKPIDDIIEAVYYIEGGISRVIEDIEILGESLGRKEYGKDLKSIAKRTLYIMLLRLLFKYSESVESILKLVLSRKRMAIHP